MKDRTLKKHKKKKTLQPRPSTLPLTRAPLPPLQPTFGFTPPWLYSAILGNGHVLVCLDDSGSIAQIFYPYIDAGPNVGSWLCGIQVSNTTNTNRKKKKGKDAKVKAAKKSQDAVYWLADEGWKHELQYVDGAAILSVLSVHEVAGLRVEQTMAVHPDKDLYANQIKLTNEGLTPVDCKLVTYASLDIKQRMSGNTCYFDTGTSSLTFFAADSYLSIRSDAPVDGFAAEKTSLNGPDQLFEGVSAGKFSGCEYAIGQVSGAVRHDFGLIEAGGNAVISLHLLFGRSLEGVAALSASVAGKQMDFEEVANWWRGHIARTRHEAVPSVAERVYNRSLITLRLLTDAGTGGIVAAPECDPDFRACGGYGPCWPRDGAFIAHALDEAGQYDHARLFYDWALRAQSESGVWYQRYYVNGQLAPTWGLVQFDETGAVVWAVGRHIQLTGDIAYAQKALPHMVRACEYMQRSLDAETGLAPITKDLWEEWDGISTYACASTWAGFQQTAEVAAKLGEIAEAERWATEAARLKSAIEAHLWDASHGRFLRGMMKKIYAPDVEQMRAEPGFAETDIVETQIAGKTRYFRRKDTTIDTAILGLAFPFGVFSPDDPRMLASMEAISTHLASEIGGIRRYADDHYRGGNPWVICTLWLALQYVAIGQKERALSLYNWTLDHRTALDLLPEQVDRATGEPCWVVPLGWSHAMFILATLALNENEQ